MSDADRAYELAQREIAEAKRTGAERLDFSAAVFWALDRLPPEICELADAQHLDLSQTQIADLSPLEWLMGLQSLELFDTQITDLAPLAGLRRLHMLSLNNTQITDLSPIAEMTRLRGLYLGNTQITDLKPLEGLTELQRLGLDRTRITDIAPLAGLPKLENLGLDYTRVSDLRPAAAAMGETLNIFKHRDLNFADTPATKLDKQLAELARIKDNRERTRETLAYLRTLPPWPEPYTPAATLDGSTPQPIGGKAAPVGPQATKSQIAHLLRNAAATRLTAQEFASQIRTALHDVPATDGNKLAEPLQTMLEFADVLDCLAPQSEPATDPLDRAKLELRIAQLEKLVTRLTQQLRDETKARDAAEALAGKGAFARSFKEEAGKQVARAVVWVPSVVICTGLYQAATHYLGVGNPVLEGMSRLLLKPGD